MSKRNIEIYTESVLREAAQIVIDLFANAFSIEQAVETLNKLFSSYQEVNKDKMNPLLWREGRLSCSGASLLFALWAHFNGYITVCYVEQNLIRDEDHIASTKLHTFVELNSKDEDGNVVPIGLFNLWGNHQTKEYRFTSIPEHKTKFYFQNPHRSRAFPSIGSFTANRISVMGLKRCKKRLIISNNADARFIGKESALLSFYKDLYLSSRK